MRPPELIAALRSLQDGTAAPGTVDEVRAALADHPVGAELPVDELFGDDPVADASALLAVLEATPQPDVADALTAAPAADVADAVMAALFGTDCTIPVADAVASEAGRGPEVARGFDPAALPVAEAVAEEAGRVDVVAPVMAAIAGAAAAEPTGDLVAVAETEPDPAVWASLVLDRALDDDQHVLAAERVAADAAVRDALGAFADVGRRVREAVRAEAGHGPDLWRSVAAGIGIDDPERVEGWDETRLGAAVRAEAGAVDVAPAVMATLEREMRPRSDVVEEIELADAVGANDGAWLPVAAMIAVAAAIVMAVGLPRLLAGSEDPAFTERRDVTFASTDEVSVDSVRYGENASVFVEVPEDDGAPIIIWVDDGDRL